MAKSILIFSDGTGQIGGINPDQRLSNVYKMYRAMRPGPQSSIKPSEQVAFYDPGLGAGETDGLTFRRLRRVLSSAVGTGIDANVIDCYAAIISYYEPGDRICLFGFSRGAYTVRSLANVLNLCGVPTKNSQGGAVPKYGPKLRKIASDGVRYVYNHGAGSRRDEFEREREAKAKRFRKKYGSEGFGADGEPQGNVQPNFVGVFDTVAALKNRYAARTVEIAGVVLLIGTLWAYEYSWWIFAPLAIVLATAIYWYIVLVKGQIKYFFEDPNRKPKWFRPWDWWAVFRNGHIAWWSGKHYDRYVDREIPYLRHALAIDEWRRDFPRVAWGRGVDVKWNEEHGNPDWLKQVWFAGNHSDIGGSYPEEESRLSDISLDWMVEELKVAIPEIIVRDEILVRSGDPTGLQHDECEAAKDRLPTLLRWLTLGKLAWPEKVRDIHSEAPLHQSVFERFEASAVPQMGDVKPYRPSNLRNHHQLKMYYR